MNAPLSNCLWLAAFPKSGSTWCRFLFHNLLFGPPSSSDQLNHRLPSIHDDRSLAAPAISGGGVVLTHKAAHTHVQRYGVPRAFVQVVRHPADVALSDANHFVLTQLDGYLRSQGRTAATEADTQELARLFLLRLLQDGNTPKQQRLGMGTWSENVGSWLMLAPAIPSIVLRYEDLKAQPVVELERLVAFLGLPVSRTHIEQAVANSSLSAMKRMQEREIAERIPGRFYEARHEAAYKAGVRFVNAGKVGRSATLPPAVLERLAELYAGPLERCGYGVSDGKPVVAARPPELDTGARLEDGTLLGKGVLA